jgi:hypothetical protein
MWSAVHFFVRLFAASTVAPSASPLLATAEKVGRSARPACSL